MIESDNLPDYRRLRVLYALIFTGFAAIVVRLWFLQIVKTDEFLEQAQRQQVRIIRRIAPRGDIIDAKGRILATTRPHYVVSVLPDEIKKHPESLERLIRLLKLDPADVETRMEAGRESPHDPVPLLEDVEQTNLAIVEEHQNELPGMLISNEPKRYYQVSETCTHLLGIVRPISSEKLKKLRSEGYRGGDYIGTEGLEASYESHLRGTSGGRPIEVDAKGRMKRSLGERPPTPGHTLRLTLDLDLQRVTHEALQAELAKGRTGAAVAIDPNDGAVLAFASSPSYDLNTFGKSYSDLRNDKRLPLYNRVMQMKHSCGSPFKLITAAAGLETKALSTNSADKCSGYIMVGNRRFNCDQRSGHGHIEFYHAIAASCDVFFYHAGQRIGIDALADWAHHFGLGERTEIDLPAAAESAGRIPSPEWKKKHRPREPWVPGDLVNMAIGQGYVGVTPLQLAVFTAALANGGDILRPQLVREILEPSEGAPTVVHRLQRNVRKTSGLSREHRDAIVEGMRRVLKERGTAAGVAISGLTVAGKTGTVEAIVDHQDVNHSVFVCFAPIENPKIAIAVVIEKGGMGADAAAPLARKMLMEYFHIPTNIPLVAPRPTRSRGNRIAAPPKNTPASPETPAPSSPEPKPEGAAPQKREEEPTDNGETPSPNPDN